MQTTDLPGYRIRPLDWPEARGILRSLFEDHEHWILVLHGSAAKLLVEIEQRYYFGERTADFTVITAIHHGEAFGIVAASKKWMRPYQLVSLLRQITVVRISEREMIRKDLGIIAPDRGMNAAEQLAISLLASDDLAISE